MSVLTTARAVAISRQLQDILSKQLATMPVVTLSYDATDQSPILTFSADATPATGEKVAVVKVVPTSALAAYDIFNNAGNKYGPHVVQICTEKNYAGATDNVADILTPVELLPLLMECGRAGCAVEWYQTANGTVPSNAAIVAGNLIKKWAPIYAPLATQ
jgi:hypothetical protein